MAEAGLGRQRDSQAFPCRQLFVLGLCRICEPIAFMSIFPYIYYMIESFQITDDSNRIALYAGLVTSVFAAAECLGAGFWGSLSDRLGRKPILLCGIAGTGISMIMFGFAPNLPMALLARALGGALNGNIGVLQTTVTEVIKVEAHQARAYAIMPTVWCLGAIVGSALGGALASPVENYPGLFHSGTIFDRFPYLLTNLVCTGVVVFSLIVGFLFLEETHEDLKHRSDLGLKVGNWLLNRFRKSSIVEVNRAHGDFDDERHHLTDDLPPDYSTTSSPAMTPVTPPPAYSSHAGTPRDSLNASDRVEETLRDIEDGYYQDKPRSTGVQSAFSKQVMLNICGFGLLAYHTISAEQLLPVLLSMPPSDAPVSLPFKFTGGFALPTKTIGGILSVQGVMQMIATIVIFPIVNRKIGSLWTYRCAIFTYPLLYLVVPYITLLPDRLRLPAIYLILAWKVTGQAFAYPSSSIMLANAAASTKVLGTLNGAAASAASASRAVGPTLSGLLQAGGLSIGTLGLPWWVNVLVASGGAVMSLFMVEEKRRAFSTNSSSSSNSCGEKDSMVEDDLLPDEAGIPDLANCGLAVDSTSASCYALLSDPASPLLSRTDTSQHEIYEECKR